MNMKIKGNQAINGDIEEPDAALLTFADDLTNDARSAIVRNHNIGEYVYNRIDRNSWDVWAAAKLITDLLEVIATERIKHSMRRKGGNE